jgi:hypothetical protein
MASYRGHLTFGGVVAAGGIAASSAFTPLTDVSVLMPLFLLVLAGSLMPDIDSDSSLPFYLAFGAFSFIVLTIVIHDTLLMTTDSTQRLLVPAIAFLILWFGVRYLFQKFTHHRGMFHSIPAIGIAAMVTIVLALKLQYTPLLAVLFGIALGLGYLSHLLLDEIWAMFGLNRWSLIPNKAFGTALKLWYFSSHTSSVVTYVLLIGLFYATEPSFLVALPIISPYINFIQFPLLPFKLSS